MNNRLLTSILFFQGITRVFTLSSLTQPKVQSLGAAIQTAVTVEQCLELCKHSQYWIPSDPDLPHHLQQRVHHEKRYRLSSQLLEKMFLASGKNKGDIPLDDRFERIVMGACIPQEHTIVDDVKAKAPMLNSLKSIYGYISRKLAKGEKVQLSRDTLDAIELLIARISQLSEHYSLNDSCEIVWSTHGLYSMLPELERTSSLDNLENRVSVLPFQIIPRGLDWSEILSSQPQEKQICHDLINEIPFSKDTIITRRGEAVKERRGTAWLGEESVGALAYSGKLMPRKKIGNIVNKVMRSVENTLNLNEGGETFFDCALCNHYADSSAACKWHTDPEHGSVWHRTTTVVAAGTDRVFAFKPIDSQWKDWDPLTKNTNNDQNMAAAIHLFSGDLVVMTENCNDDFYHAVHAGDNDDDRVSLVLKKALDRNGKKGHSESGQGRRSRRKMNVSASASAADHTTKNSNNNNYNKTRRRQGNGNSGNSQRRKRRQR